MPAQNIKVTPSVMLNAAASVAATAEQAAKPPATLPEVVPGSPADAAWGVIATGMATQTGQMSAEISGKGPEIQAKTQAGVAQFQAQDEENAAQIRSVGNSAEAGPGPTTTTTTT